MSEQGGGITRRTVAKVSAAIAFAVGVLSFVASADVQDYVCGWGWVVKAQDQFPTQVRAVCRRPSAWTPTPAEITVLVDDFLAKASFAKPEFARTELFTQDAKNAQDEPNFLSAWTAPNWSQRVGPIVKREGGKATLVYQRYSWNENVPAQVELTSRKARVSVIFDDRKNPKFETPWFASRVEPGDSTVSLQRALIGTDTRAYGYPDPADSTSFGSALPAGDTVRLICHLKLNTSDFVRSTDGWVLTDALKDGAVAASLPPCEQQHASSGSD